MRPLFWTLAIESRHEVMKFTDRAMARGQVHLLRMGGGLWAEKTANSKRGIRFVSKPRIWEPRPPSNRCSKRQSDFEDRLKLNRFGTSHIVESGTSRQGTQTPATPGNPAGTGCSGGK